MVNEQIALDKILNSKWSKKYNFSVESFIKPASEIRYALYSVSLDRFLIVDDLDLWSVTYAADILSSKMILTICIFAVHEPEFKIHNCLQWSLSNKDEILPKKQSPGFYRVFDNSELICEGVPVDFADDIEKLVAEQEFALFVLKAVVSARLTDFLMGRHSEAKNENQKIYLDLMDEGVQTVKIEKRPDKTAWHDGFLGEISRLLYRTNSIDEFFSEFEKMSDDLLKSPSDFKFFRGLYFDNFRTFLAPAES